MSISKIVVAGLCFCAAVQPIAGQRIDEGVGLPDAPAAQDGPQKMVGVVRGEVVDQSGRGVQGAEVLLTQPKSNLVFKVISDAGGHYEVTGIAPGTFRLTISAPSFAPQVVAQELLPGQSLMMQPIVLAPAVSIAEVHVSMTRVELAQQQIEVEEKQRVFGVIPNFYVTYNRDAQPLTSKQKFELASKTLIDPFTFVGTGIVAGIEQGTNAFSGYGQGAEGYAKRYGAGYADGAIGTMLGGAVFPSLFKQDPRYFYQGTGSVSSRIGHALAYSVLCRGDSGRLQFDYSGILGGLVAGGISNLYYPDANQTDAAITFENTGIGIASSAVANLFQEFLVRRLSTHSHDVQPGQE